MPELKTKIEYSVWCEPVFRGGKLVLVKGDVTEAIKWYTEKTGHPPGKITIAPSNQYHSGEIPEGMEVELKTGLCSWEIWLSGEKKPEEKLPEEKIAPAKTIKTPLPPTRMQKSGHKNSLAVNSTTRIMKQLVVYPDKCPKPVVIKIVGRRGRPLKLGEVSKVTLWRRNRNLKMQTARLF